MAVARLIQVSTISGRHTAISRRKAVRVATSNGPPKRSSASGMPASIRARERAGSGRRGLDRTWHGAHDGERRREHRIDAELVEVSDGKDLDPIAARRAQGR